jgi:thiol-disulfide isomerase/thioredoxin
MASELFRARVTTADLGQLALAISRGRSGGQEVGGGLEIARALLLRVKQEPRHEDSAELLTCVCRLSENDSSDTNPSPIFSDAADVIAAQYATSPDITNFCELLGRGAGSPAWAGPFERHLKSILRANQHRHVRCAAAFALASVVQSSEDRQGEAEELYQHFLNDFDGQYEYHFQGIEQSLREGALKELNELKAHAFGNPTPEIVGVDLDGKPMKLSDYHGKVVVLSFWATWCSPCMKFIPREKALADRLKTQNFAIVGVNGDTDHSAAESAVRSNGIAWRSFRNERTDRPRISQEWSVTGWPTIYLIDRDGILRNRWRNDLSSEDLDHAVNALVLGSGDKANVGEPKTSDPVSAEINKTGDP